MLNKHLNLNPKLFDSDVEQAPLRDGFGKGLVKAAEINEKVVGLCADVTESVRMHWFAQKFPDRFIQTGVTEQHMASCASGIAAMGKIPFISSYAMFNGGRNWEQIRTTICYNDVPVKIAGSHSGLSVGPDGGTHQALEDMALMRVIPRMEVVAPCDALEAEKATVAIANTKNPSYLRLAREQTPVITTADTPFEIGKSVILWDNTAQVDCIENRKPPTKNSRNSRVAIIACGTMVHKALVAGRELASRGFGVIVVNNHTIKPLDKSTLLNVASKVDFVITAESHQIYGGLGGAIAELLSENMPKRMAFIGVRDKFGQSGTGEELFKHYKMTHVDMVNAAITFAEG